ncbi:phage baseplate upper protein [Mammaliicoccus sciuri]|uniref:BppU family phage baseplate upper protein n=1 Tax=Mammaliicoccus sciuri TaxID=1296 RepID=UPI002DBE3A32|nr:BppU family phage baseplate upper protein [Mammaliicoccus sciuri]MEB6226335.1 phage baseplate upper protein [Mammaliicoccus sciuri]
MAINKIGTLRHDINAHYKKTQNTNIMFYNMDINTSTLKFIITRNDKILPLGKNNVDTYIYLEASDGSFIQDDVAITDELNGICEYVIPNEFLNHTGKAKGQFYISVDNKEDTVTSIDFTFEIKDALINGIPSVVKLNTIRKYDELEKILKEKVHNIEEAYKNIDDYITRVQNASNDGVSLINDTKDSALVELENSKNTHVNQIETTGTEYANDLTDIRTGINEKIDQFNIDVENNDFITEPMTDTWQKYKLTEDSGQVVDVSLENNIDKLHNLKPGFYFATLIPITGASADSGFVEVLEKNSGALKRITFKPHNSNQVWTKRFYNTWNDWELSNKDMETTYGSQEKVDLALSEAKQYTDSSMVNRRKTLWSGDARERNTVFAINESYKNFSYLLVRYRFSGGGKTVSIHIDTDKKIPIQDFNMTDAAGDNPKMNEMGLIFTTDTDVKVTHNNSFDVKGQRNLYDDNDIVLKEIIGVR